MPTSPAVGENVIQSIPNRVMPLRTLCTLYYQIIFSGPPCNQQKSHVHSISNKQFLLRLLEWKRMTSKLAIRISHKHLITGSPFRIVRVCSDFLTPRYNYYVLTFPLKWNVDSPLNTIWSRKSSWTSSCNISMRSWHMQHSQ